MNSDKWEEQITERMVRLREMLNQLPLVETEKIASPDKGVKDMSEPLKNELRKQIRTIRPVRSFSQIDKGLIALVAMTAILALAYSCGQTPVRVSIETFQETPQ